MRVTFVGHACHLVEVGGLRILTDPWLVDPIFGGFVEHAPALGCAVADLPPLDAIALSHGHLDHFNAPTLAALPDKSIPVIHPPIRFSELDSNLARLGFVNRHALEDFEAFALGAARIVATPSLGVMDECAWLIEGEGGRFWNGVDAPQVPTVMEEIAQRFAPIDLAALSHNSFDQPALLALPSFKDADHGPTSAAASARTLEARHAFAASSNMRWTGPHAEETTAKVIRRRPEHLAGALASGAPEVKALDLVPGDAWSREGGVERGVLRGTPAPRVESDYIHPFLGTGERFCGPARPESEEAFRVHLPKRTADAAEASRYVEQPVYIEVVGEDTADFTVDFREPGAVPEPGDRGAAFGVRILDEDWKDLFERRISWQVLLVSDRLAVTRYEPGPPPLGLHFCFALQAVFP